MKNKSKLAKIKKNKVQQVPKDWLYMCPEELELIKIKELLEADYSVEFWEEAGVLEVELQSEDPSSIDFESVDISRADEITKNFMDENGIKEVFLVSLRPESYEAAKNAMERVLSKYAGFFCGDTEEFSPIVK